MILHVDLDAFFASVEQRDRPELRGKPVLVGGLGGRSVVCAASYESRKFGCRSAMPMATARRACPQAIVVAPRMRVYAAESQRFRAILERYTPLVEPISIDEAFLDVGGSERLYGDGAQIGAAIRGDVRRELDLAASVGGAAVKLVAKIASDLAKPDGLRVVPAGETESFLAPLPVERLFGVGPKSAQQLRGLGITTLGQLARYPTEALTAKLGRGYAGELQALARGQDPRPVEPEREAKSIGAEETFATDLVDGPELRRRVTAQAERVAERLRRNGLVGATVQLKLKDPQFHITTRRRTLPSPTADGRVIIRAILQLLDEARVTAPGVRLSGVALSSLSAADAPRQLGLDEPERQKGERLGATLDKIRDRFGSAAVARAELLGEDE